MTDDRQAALDAGLTLGRALGSHEAREALDRLGYHDGIHLVPLNLGGLEQHLPPAAIAEAAFELATTAPEQLPAVIAAWRSTAEAYANPQLLAALTRDSHEDGSPVPQPCGGGVPCTDDCSHGQAFRQLVALDEELGVYDQPAPTREDWREIRQQVAEEQRGYQQLADSHDAEDAAYRQATRARKRGRPET